MRRREHNWGGEEVVDAGEHTAGKATAAGRCVAGSSAVEVRGSTRRRGARRRERDSGRECAAAAAGSVPRRLFFSTKSRRPQETTKRHRYELRRCVLSFPRAKSEHGKK